MSLLNDVLSDLEKNKSNGESSHSILSIPIGINSKKNNDRQGTHLYLVFFFCTIFLGYWGYNKFLAPANTFDDLRYPTSSSKITLNTNSLSPVLPIDVSKPNELSKNTLEFDIDLNRENTKASENKTLSDALELPPIAQALENKDDNLKNQQADELVEDIVTPQNPQTKIQDISISKALDTTNVEINNSETSQKVIDIVIPSQKLSVTKSTQEIENINEYFINDQYDLLFLLTRLKDLFSTNMKSFERFFSKQSQELLLSEPQLLDLLGLLESFDHEYKKKWIHNIYDQLSIKSNQWGYWAFIYAVDLDRMSDNQKAVYFYKKSLESIHLTQRQRGLSRLRLSQLDSLE